MARIVACRMFTRSMVRWSTMPTPTATARSWMSV